MASRSRSSGAGRVQGKIAETAVEVLFGIGLAKGAGAGNVGNGISSVAALTPIATNDTI